MFNMGSPIAYLSSTSVRIPPFSLIKLFTISFVQLIASNNGFLCIENPEWSTFSQILSFTSWSPSSLMKWQSASFLPLFFLSNSLREEQAIAFELDELSNNLVGFTKDPSLRWVRSNSTDLLKYLLSFISGTAGQPGS